MTTKAQREAAFNAAVQEAVEKAMADAQAGLVAAQQKPELVSHLTSTWRKSAEHMAAQIRRFFILTLLAAIPSLSDLLSGGRFDMKTLFAFITPFAYVALRQVNPELGAAQVDSAPGVTIVPDQVGVPTAEVPVEDAEMQVALPDGEGGPVD